MNKEIWLIGTGQMSMDYANVLKSLETPFTVIGRSEAKSAEFELKINHKVSRGGIQKYLDNSPAIPKKVIIAVNIEELKPVCELLLNYGVKDILIEKPGILIPSEINPLTDLAKEKEANVLIAYNRRFYSSVIAAEKIIQEDGGICSFNFEFTEWSHEIRTLKKSELQFHNWFLANSTHVVDLAFFIGGIPKEMCSYHSGTIDWHPNASTFSGAGISEKGALFSYHANWIAPGRWAVELLTNKHRLILKPMEKLQIQNIGSVAVNPVEVDDSLDTNFKPGLYLQTKAFIGGDYSRFCDINEQKRMINDVYLKIAGY